MAAQQIVITDTMRECAASLQMNWHLDFWSNVVTVFVFGGTATCIASFRTWSLLLVHNPLTICLWVASYLAIVLCIGLSPRKRIR